MRTAKDIMAAAFHEAMSIVQKEASLLNGTDNSSKLIAASNLAMAIFSYEAEMEAMKDAHEQMDDDDDELIIGEDGNG
jgi:hypothetical protein